MYKLDLTRDALAFWEKLDAKQYRQIGRKILSLLNQPQPADARALIGYSGYFRVDVGEFRIIYTLEADCLKLALIGKRNDGEIYSQFKRKIA